MREVPGSIPGFSNTTIKFSFLFLLANKTIFPIRVTYYSEDCFSNIFLFSGRILFLNSSCFCQKPWVEIQVNCSTVFAKTIPLRVSFSLKQISKDLISLLNYLKVSIFVFQTIVSFFFVKAINPLPQMMISYIP